MKIVAISIDADYGTSYIIETNSMYYCVNEQLDYKSIYPCPVLDASKRFRNNWFDDNGEHDVPIGIKNKLALFQADESCNKIERANERQFGEKRLEL